MEIVVHEMRPSDIEEMDREMRDLDRREFVAMSGQNDVRPELSKLLRRSLKPRVARTGDGRMIAVYGIISPTVLSTLGHPWLAGTDLVAHPAVRRGFLERSRIEFAELARGFTSLWNVVSDENKAAIRWLKWLGFEFPGESYEVGGMNFEKFEMGAKNVR
jgi:hypothetical protein